MKEPAAKICAHKFRYAQIIVDIPKLDARTFSYLIPDEIGDRIKPGMLVLVPFGAQGGVIGYVVGFSNYLPEGIKAKSIYEILDDEPVFDIDYLEFAEWTANYYGCSLQSVLEAAIPASFFAKSKRVISLNHENFFKLNEINPTKEQEKILSELAQKDGITVSSMQKKTKIPSSKFYETLRKLKTLGLIQIKNIIEEKSAKAKLERYIRLSVILPEKAKLTPKHLEVMEKLKELGGEYKYSSFLKESKTTPATVKKIFQQGAVAIFDKEVERNPLQIFGENEQEDFFLLNEMQNEALQKIKNLMESKNSEPALLFGVTGAGKTEVYLHAANYALERGKNIIILAPEILLASQLARRISLRFGIETVALWHSNISEGERFDVWEKIKSGKTRIIVGARSAIFAPVKNLGLIIIDEEHESSYKQTSPSPRYNAKTLAQKRAEKSGAALVLGSATPDIVTYYRAKNTNSILKLPKRFGKGEMAQVNIVDMREEFLSGNKSIFSRGLKKSIQKNIEDSKQSILLVNRRGFHTSGQCQNCGFVAECKSCSIPLILHKTTNRLRCHYCNHEKPVFTTCPECGSHAVKYSGMGTQRAEELFRNEFPQASVARIDSDIMTKKNAHIEIIEAFSKGEIDVIIGTQMIAKGIDIHNVTLVGVISADSLFKMPDFRSGERGFQLLTQVAGRAGRGDFKGKVYFQTYNPGFFVVQFAKQQDFTSFYNYEIQGRNELSYPPFSSLIRVIISSKSEIKSIRTAQETAYKLRLLTDTRGLSERLEVLGPSPCIIAKLKDEYRFHIIIKNTFGEKGHFMITNYLKSLNIPSDIKFITDVDPSDML